MATTWILTRRTNSLTAEAGPVPVPLANGPTGNRLPAMSMSANTAIRTRRGSRCRHDGRADRRAPRQCRHAGAAARRHRGRGARRAEAGAVREPDPFFTADATRLITHRRLRHRPPVARRRRLDHRGGRRAPRRQAATARPDRRARRPARPSSARIRPASRWRRSPRDGPNDSGSGSSARTSSTRRATCTCSS